MDTIADWFKFGTVALLWASFLFFAMFVMDEFSRMREAQRMQAAKVDRIFNRLFRQGEPHPYDDL